MTNFKFGPLVAVSIIKLFCSEIAAGYFTSRPYLHSFIVERAGTGVGRGGGGGIVRLLLLGGCRGKTGEEGGGRERVG